MSNIECLLHCANFPYEFFLVKYMPLLSTFFNALLVREAFCEHSERDAPRFHPLDFQFELLGNATFDEDRSIDPFPKISLLCNGEDEAFAALVARVETIIANKPDLTKKPEGLTSSRKACNVYEWLYVIQQRSGYYMIEPTFVHLSAWVNALYFGIQSLGFPIKITPDLDEFELWLNCKYSHGPFARWDKLLYYNFGLKDNTAFDQFFNELRLWEGLEKNRGR